MQAQVTRGRRTAHLAGGPGAQGADRVLRRRRSRSVRAPSLWPCSAGFVDERGAVLAAVTARPDGKDDSYRHAHLWTIRDGRVTSFEEFPDEGRSQDLLFEQSAPAVCSRGRAPAARRASATRRGPAH
jgi:hypothetical protein